MEKRPVQGKRSKVVPGDEVILRATVTRVVDEEVTVEVRGWSLSRITLSVDRVEKVR